MLPPGNSADPLGLPPGAAPGDRICVHAAAGAGRLMRRRALGPDDPGRELPELLHSASLEAGAALPAATAPVPLAVFAVSDAGTTRPGTRRARTVRPGLARSRGGGGERPNAATRRTCSGSRATGGLWPSPAQPCPACQARPGVRFCPARCPALSCPARRPARRVPAPSFPSGAGPGPLTVCPVRRDHVGERSPNDPDGWCVRGGHA